MRRNKKGRFKRPKQHNDKQVVNETDNGDGETYEVFDQTCEPPEIVQADYYLASYLNATSTSSSESDVESVVTVDVDYNNNDTPILESNVLQGRRIIDIGHFASEMQRGCYMCNTPLQLADCTKELKYGLASFFISGNHSVMITVVYKLVKLGIPPTKIDGN